MTQTRHMSGGRREEDGGRWAMAAAVTLGALASARLLLLFLSPVELYPDEAQYWAWSRTLDWGYFSKPPMIAWLIAGSTAAGGDGEAWVRLPAWACQAGAGAFVFAAGRRLYGSRVGFWAAVLYALAPGVQLSAGVASTDAPLMLGLSAALWTYAGLVRDGGTRWAAGLGVALGFAVLSKYAAAYFLIGLVAHAVLDRDVRRCWTPKTVAVGVGVATLCLLPNLVWNALNGFDTVEHTAANADWDPADLLNPGELVDFVVSQFVVMGPVPFAALLTGVVVLALRRRVEGSERLLLCLLAPPLLLVAGQALLSRANANWAAAFLPPAAVLVAAWLARPAPWARLALAAALVSQLSLQAVLAASTVSPRVADGVGFDNGLKRARGWAATAEAVRQAIVAEGGAARLSAVAVDDRFLFNALTYYGRDWLDDPATPPLRAWVREVEAQNQAETVAPLTAADGRRVLAVGVTPDYLAEFRADFRGAGPVTTVRIPLDARRTRDLSLFLGEGFAPRPRVSAPPTARPTGA